MRKSGAASYTWNACRGRRHLLHHASAHRRVKKIIQCDVLRLRVDPQIIFTSAWSFHTQPCVEKPVAKTSVATRTAIVPLQHIPAPRAEIPFARAIATCVMEIPRAEREDLRERLRDVTWRILSDRRAGLVVHDGRIDSWIAVPAFSRGFRSSLRRRVWFRLMLFCRSCCRCCCCRRCCCCCRRCVLPRRLESWGAYPTLPTLTLFAFPQFLQLC